MTSSSITVQWGAVDCIHHNGNITGYSVRYGVQGSGSTQTESVSGGATTEATISGLTLSTSYVIAIAAVNSAGTGVYSEPLTVETSVAGEPSHPAGCVAMVTGHIHVLHQVPLSDSWEWISPTTAMWTSLQWGLLWMAVIVYSAALT